VGLALAEACAEVEQAAVDYYRGNLGLALISRI
jgi:hypothetical protein